MKNKVFLGFRVVGGGLPVRGFEKREKFFSKICCKIRIF